MPPKSDFIPIAVATDGLSYSIKGKILLHNVDLIVEPSELLVVMGPSGAGKTTLLNNIAFRTKGGTRVGQVLFNGHPASIKTFREVCNYVMTDARMLPYLTVHETLITAAKLKLPDVPNEERIKRVEQVMVELGLTKCRNTYIGGEWKKGISTGERKRVCIAIELLNQPSILILDEPTSGLDSTLACELLSVLQRLTTSGRTVICSIHQPTSQMWSQIDRVLFLSTGSVVFHGKAADAKAYFARLGFDCPKNYNPADFYLGLLNSESTYEEPSDVSSTCSSSEVISGEIEMIAGLNETSQSKGSSDCLIREFKNSKEFVHLKKHIDVIKNSATDGDNANRVGHLKKTKNWCGEVKALYVILPHSIIILSTGGVYWNQTSSIAHQTPLRMNTTAIIDNPWTQLFMHGVDGRQLLLEALEDGVDGSGSQPLLDLINDKKSIRFLNDVLKCGSEKLHLSSHGYPTFGVRDNYAESMASPILTFPSLTSPNLTISDVVYSQPIVMDDDSYAPKHVISNIISAIQESDYYYRKMDWQSLKDALSKLNKTDRDYPFQWWITVLSVTANDMVNPFMTCAGFPAFPVAGRRLDTEKTRRNLIAIGDTGMEEAMYSLLGVGSRDFATTTKQIIDRLRTCNNKICHSIGNEYQKVVNIAQDAYAVVMVVVNVLGAIFFMVANLGFASYDALLTFPQERALFNRESANGLYGASSYFLAKNLADLPFQLIPGLVLVSVFYIFSGLSRTASQFFVYFVVCGAVTFASYGFGYFISAISPRMEVAVLIAPTILMIWLTIAGFFIRDSQIPQWIRWFSYTSYYKWGFISLVQNQFPLDGHFGSLPNRIPLIMAGISETRIWLTFFLIVLLGLCYRFAAYLALKFTNRSVGLQ